MVGNQGDSEEGRTKGGVCPRGDCLRGGEDCPTGETTRRGAIILATFCRVPESPDFAERLAKAERKFQQAIDLVPEAIFAKDSAVRGSYNSLILGFWGSGALGPDCLTLGGLLYWEIVSARFKLLTSQRESADLYGKSRNGD